MLASQLLDFTGDLTSIAKKPNIFCDFSWGGGGCPGMNCSNDSAAETFYVSCLVRCGI